MTTLSLISIVTLGVSILGIASMLWWGWHESRRREERGLLRRCITAFDDVVLVVLYRGGRATRVMSQRLERGVYSYLPELLLEFTIGACHVCYVQFKHMQRTLRGQASQRRRPRGNASEYMRSLGSLESDRKGKEGASKEF